MNDSISQQLRQMREAQSLSLEQVSHATHIRLHYLKAIEAGDFSALPSQAQARGFVRSYASFLKMDADALVSALTEEAALTMKVKTTPPVVKQPVLDLDQADAIFFEIGSRLRTQRELLDLTLEDVERHTHIRNHYLQALEDGNIRDLPSPVQARGMLNNYASFLGMETEPVLLQYAEGLQAELSARQQLTRPSNRPAVGRRNWSERGLRSFFSGDFFIGGALSILLVVFVLWGFTRISDLRGGQLLGSPTPTARPISEVLMGVGAASQTAESSTPSANLQGSSTQAPGQTSLAGITLSGENPTTESSLANGTQEQPAVEFTPPAAVNSPVQIHVVISQRAWMRILVDEKIAFEGRVTAGSAYSYYGDRRIEILTSNGAALQVYYNQLNLGSLGLFGEVVNRIYTAQEVQTPTATITPTGMVPPTSTPGPTGTSPSTSTGTATPTGLAPAATSTPSP